MKTFVLTSPHMQGEPVADFQRLFNGHGYGHLVVDGDYGSATAAAARRAKYALGYPTMKIDGAAGAELHGYLTGTPLPIAYRLRARARAQKPTIRAAALANLISKLGVSEDPPDSNRCWASEWYGLIGPWCAMAVTWAYVTAGSKTFVRASRYAFVPFLEHDARAGVNGLSITTEPQPGDPVIFDWNSNGVADHVGLFDHWTDRPNGLFATVEGNTAIGNDSNGGEVMRRERSLHTARVVFVHVPR